MSEQRVSTEVCCDEGWACEVHVKTPWPHKIPNYLGGQSVDCPGPGMPCPDHPEDIWGAK